MGDPVRASSPGSKIPILWEKENFTASLNGVDDDGDGCDFTRDAPYKFSGKGHKDGLSKGPVRIFGSIKFSKEFRFAPFAPGAKSLKEAGPSADAFDQVFALHTLTSLFEYFSGIGLDIEEFLRVGDRRNTATLKANVNTEDICNAWYSPTDGELTFGRCEKMHTAADGDIVTHEFGHWLLDKLNPRLLEPTIIITDNWWPVPHKLYAGEQDAIHEGFADALAAIVNGNPVISEDSWVFTGEKPGNGLRNVENKIKRKGLGPEPHERGKVYGGFFWSMHKRIEAMLEKMSLSGDAAAVSLALMWEHALHYRVTHPNTEQFVDAMLAGANALFNAEKIELDPFELRDAILEEAISRELVDEKYADARRKEEKTDLPEGFMMQAGGTGPDSPEAAISAFKKDGKTGFEAPQRTWTSAGTHDFYPQVYTTSSGAKVEVIGNGLTVEKIRPKGMRFKRGGEFTHVFTDGVRDVSKSGAVDEAINIAEKAALSKVAGAVFSLGKRAAAELSATKKKRAAGDEARMKTGLLHRDTAALKSAGALLSQGGGKAARLVLLPGKSTLSWRFDAGEITGYVDAKSGKVAIVRNYIVD